MDDADPGTRDVSLSDCYYIPFQHPLACMKNPTALAMVITSNIPMNRMVRRHDRKIRQYAGRGIVTVPKHCRGRRSMELFRSLGTVVESTAPYLLVGLETCVTSSHNAVLAYIVPIWFY